MSAAGPFYIFHHRKCDNHISFIDCENKPGVRCKAIPMANLTTAKKWWFDKKCNGISIYTLINNKRSYLSNKHEGVATSNTPDTFWKLKKARLCGKSGYSKSIYHITTTNKNNEEVYLTAEGENLRTEKFDGQNNNSVCRYQFKVMFVETSEYKIERSTLEGPQSLNATLTTSRSFFSLSIYNNNTQKTSILRGFKTNTEKGFKSSFVIINSSGPLFDRPSSDNKLSVRKFTGFLVVKFRGDFFLLRNPNNKVKLNNILIYKFEKFAQNQKRNQCRLPCMDNSSKKSKQNGQKCENGTCKPQKACNKCRM